MKPFWITFFLAATLLLSAPANSAGLAPWEFGMSKAQVRSFERYGPYRSFTNGDLETYGGIYDERKENVQFFFDNDKLRRIGVYLYEGTDPEAAREVWRQAYESLTRKYGKIETPGVVVKPGTNPADSEALSVAAAAALIFSEKVQMAPVNQPSDMFVFSSFFRRDVQGSRYYWVVINLDPRH